MYKFIKPQAGDLSTYCTAKAAILRPVIQSFLNGETFSLAVRNRRSVQIGVGSGTMTRRFLNSLLQADKLEKFLELSYYYQKSLIKGLYQNKYPDDLIFKPLGAGIYDYYFDGKPEPYDDFNEICYEIFVNRGYETIDKGGFIQDTHIRICPYCGMEVVKQSARSKRQIDHYLPKRKYPFFALCYYNLIPACDLCNEAPNKGQTDPLVEWGKGNVIMQPYGFNDNIVRFHVDIVDINVFNPENFNVKVGFTSLCYLKGYDMFFDISDRYTDCNHCASEDYSRFMDFKASPFYNKMNMDRDWLKKAYKAVLSFSPDSDTPYLKERHRMRIDFFEQLNKLRQPGAYYVKGYGNNAIELE